MEQGERHDSVSVLRLDKILLGLDGSECDGNRSCQSRSLGLGEYRRSQSVLSVSESHCVR